MVLTTDRPAMTKEAGKAEEKSMMGCRCSTGTSGIDLEDWQRVRCLLLSNI